MQTNTHTINYLSLFQKYNGKIMLADEAEMRAAANSLPEGENALTAIFYAARQYEELLDEKYNCSGVVPAVCVNKDDLCEDDHCRCWK